MIKQKKNIYLAALANAINNDDELDLICKAIGFPDGTESQDADERPYLETARTEISEILRGNDTS